MFLIPGCIFLAIGCVMLFKTEWIYELKNDLENKLPGEPTKFWLYNIRFGGVMFSLVGISGIIYQFIV